jgi:hypothetical protein
VLRDLELRPEQGRLVRVLLAAPALGLLLWAIHTVGAGLVVLALVAAVSYPLILLALGALVPSELRALIRREVV